MAGDADELDHLLDRIEGRYLDGDLDAARSELARAEELFPGELSLTEWEATLARDEERLEDSLALFDAILARDPESPFAARERCALLVDLGRFEEALEAFDALPDAEACGDDPVELAEIHFDRAVCLDRLGRIEEADGEFREAARLAPEHYPAPSRMAPAEFDALVAQALDSLPEVFGPYLRQVAVTVRDYPAQADMDPFLLGLYAGLPRTERPIELEDHLDNIIIFKRNHELLNLGPDEVREEVRKTVIHEIAHHFGLEEDDMGEYA